MKKNVLTFNNFLKEEINMDMLKSRKTFTEDEIRILKRYGFNVDNNNNNIAIGEEGDIVIKIKKGINFDQINYNWVFLYNDYEFDEGYENSLNSVFLQISDVLDTNIKLVNSYKNKKEIFDKLPRWKKIIKRYPILTKDPFPDDNLLYM
jgi:hypothetical protein